MSDLNYKHNELTFQLIAEYAPNALILVNKEGKIAFVNEQVEKQFDYKRNELIGRNVEILIPSRFGEKHPGLRSSFFDDPKSRSMGIGRELFARRKDGNEFPVEIGLNPIVTSEGTIVLASIIDITERKKAEVQLALLASIVNSSDDAIISKTLDGIITSWNPGAEKLFGYTSDELIGKNIAILIPPNRVDEEPRMIECIKNGKHVDHYETERVCKDGTIVCISLTLSPIKNSNGKIIGASKIARDISERKKTEKELEKNRELFKALVENEFSITSLMDEKFSTIYRSPSSKSILGFTELEREFISPDELTHPDDKKYQREKMKEVLANPDKLINLIIRSKHKNGEYKWLEGVSVNRLHDSNVKGIVSNFRDITDRKIAEEKVEKSEMRYRALLESNNDAITLHDAKGVVFYQSPAVERITGYCIDDLKNKSAFDLFHPDYILATKQRMEEALNNPGKAIYGINRLKHKDGHYIWTEGTTTNLLEDENVEGLVGNFWDITDRKIAEEKILKSNRLYSFLSGINQAIVHKKNEQSLFNEVCRIATEIGKFELAWIGFFDEKENKINITAQSNATTDDIEVFNNIKYDFEISAFKTLLAGNYYLRNNLNYEIKNEKWAEYAKKQKLNSVIMLPIKKAGKTIGTLYIHSTITDFFDENEIALLDEVVRDISFALDVFEKENSLIHSEIRLKGAQAMTHLGDWELDFRTQKTSWSDEHYRIYGLEPGTEVPSLKLALNFVHHDDFERVSAEIAQAQKALTSFEHFRRIKRKDGSIRHLYCTSLFEFDKSNIPVRFYGASLDITELKEKEENLKQAIYELETFIYRASHDLRGPISSILGLTECAKTEFTEPNLLQYIHSINNLANKLDKTLLRLVQIMSFKNKELIFKGVIMDELLKEALHHAEHIDGFKEVLFSISNHSNSMVYTQKELLFSIFVSLVENAIIFRNTDADISEVKVIIQNIDQNNFQIEITDNGIGIADESKDKIFDLFYRGSNNSRGSGLGLYLVKKSVEKLGGNIQFNSEKGKGSTFIIQLPNYSSEQIIEATPIVKTLIKVRISDFICIDDDIIDNMISTRTIQKLSPGASIKIFTEPQEGLSYIQDHYSDMQANKSLLFLDINMPKLNGWEIVDKFKSLSDIVKQNIKIIMLSSSSNPEDIEKANNNPMISGFIQKPLTKLQLEEILGDI